jgi:hypothetical protein
MINLELAINQHLTALRVVERAVHVPWGWTMRAGGYWLGAQVIVSDFGVTFWCAFPPLGEGNVMAELLHKDEVVWCREFALPGGDQGSELEWTFSVDQAQTSALA